MIVRDSDDEDVKPFSQLYRTQGSALTRGPRRRMYVLNEEGIIYTMYLSFFDLGLARQIHLLTMDAILVDRYFLCATSKA